MQYGQFFHTLSQIWRIIARPSLHNEKSVLHPTFNKALHLLTYKPLVAALMLAGFSCYSFAQNTTEDNNMSWEEESFPDVLSATRLRQPRSEVPASMTVIDQATIYAMNVRTLPEVLRLVPGVTVGYERGHAPEVGYHTLNSENSRHLQVLIDGRSVFQPALARILWNDLPLVLDKIQRIEVVRGPNTAMFGANSYNAVINIITQQPEDRLGTRASLTQGNFGINDGFISHAEQNGDLAYELTAGFYGDDGFEINRDDSPRFDGHDAKFLAADFKWQLESDSELRLQLGVTNNEKEIDDFDSGELGDFHLLHVRNSFAQINWQTQFADNSELKAQLFFTETDSNQSWTTCGEAIFFSDELFDLFQIDPAFTESLLANLAAGDPPPVPPSPEALAQAQQVLLRLQNNGLNQVCGNPSQSLLERRGDFELQYSYKFGDSARLVSGINFRDDRAEGESYFARPASKDLWRVFTHVEYRVSDQWLLNVGGLFESDNLIGDEFTPRISANWTISNRQSLRFIYSRANRSPDLFEEQGRREFRVRNLSQPVNGSATDGRFYQSAASPGGLSFEQIISKEIGWYFRSEQGELEVDLKLFHDKLFHLLEGDSATAAFNLQNTGTIDATGIEGQLDWQATPDFRLRLTAATLNQANVSNDFFQRTSADYTLGANLFYNITPSLRWAAAYYQYENFFRVDYQQLDNHLTYRFDLTDMQLEARLGYQRRLDNNHLLDLRSRFTNPDRLYINATLRW